LECIELALTSAVVGCSKEVERGSGGKREKISQRVRIQRSPATALSEESVAELDHEEGGGRKKLAGGQKKKANSHSNSKGGLLKRGYPVLQPAIHYQK